MAEVLFVSKEDIVRRSPIMDGNIDADKIIPALHLAQTQYLREIIGTDLYEYYVTAIQALPGTPIPTDHANLLNNYIKPILIHLATSEYLKSAAYTVSNGGVFKRTSENSSEPSLSEVKELIQVERDRAESYTQRFLDHMSFNASAKYPQWFSNSNEDISPNYESYTIDWVL